MKIIMNCQHSESGWCLDCVKELASRVLDAETNREQSLVMAQEMREELEDIKKARSTMGYTMRERQRQLGKRKRDNHQLRMALREARKALKGNGGNFSYGDGPDMLWRLADVLEQYSSDKPGIAGWVEGWIMNLRNKADAEREVLNATAQIANGPIDSSEA